MKTLILILIISCSAEAQNRCIELSIKPVVYGKLDTTHSYVKEIVLQHWPYESQMPEEDSEWCKRCKQRIEVEIQEPYWKKPKQYTFKEFKKLIYGK